MCGDAFPLHLLNRLRTDSDCSHCCPHSHLSCFCCRLVDALTPLSPQSTTSCDCCNDSRRLSTGGCAPSPMSPSPTKNPVTPSPITPPPVPDACASITHKRSCKKSRSAGCKWKKSNQTCYKKLDHDFKSGKGGKRGKSFKKLFE